MPIIYEQLTQYSPEWWAIKAKKMSASHAQAIGNCGKGLKTYIESLMCDYYSKRPKEIYTNKHLERGFELEDSASMAYSFDNNIPIKKVGFVVYNDHVGCSPDLFAGEDGLAEIKCHDDKAHFPLIVGGEFESIYIWQVQMQMLVCNKKWCDLMSYNPNFDKYLVVKRVTPDKKKHEQLLEGFKIGEKIIKEIEQKMEN